MSELVYMYNNNGDLEETIYICNGKKNGRYTRYCPSGQIVEICTYIDGMKHGEYKTFWSNGEIETYCFYVDDMFCLSLGFKPLPASTPPRAPVKNMAKVCKSCIKSRSLGA